MQKPLLALLLAPITAAALPTAMAHADLATANRHAQAAFNAIDSVNGADWDTAIINLNRAIAASDSQCWDYTYSQYLDWAQQAKQLRRDGASESYVAQWWAIQGQDEAGDCEGEIGP